MLSNFRTIVYAAIIILWGSFPKAYAQNDLELYIKGSVVDAQSNRPIAGAWVKSGNNSDSVLSASDGTFRLKLSKPGFYILYARAWGYKSGNSEEQLVTYDKQAPILIALESLADTIEAVNIRRASLQKRDAGSPLSSQELSIREIERNPGGNRDISKIIQSLPGVITIPGFRNDIVIRGGAPSENKFYLDGIEIPVINHFQTQGSTGGPVGLLNVNFIKKVNFYTGAFPVNLSNGLSSVFDFQQIEGNREKGNYRFTVGSSDLGFTADGPLGKKATYIFSARQSYLQGLFSVLGLPFLPNFIDYQGKVQIDLGKRDKLTILTVGAVDYFRLNTGVNNGITDSVKLKTNRYILGYVPDYAQWNYTFGTVYTHFGNKTKTQVFLSRNMLYNQTTKYQNNDDSDPNNLILNYKSTEEENKLRVEHSGTNAGYKWLLGGGTEFAQYGIDESSKFVTSRGLIQRKFISNLDLFKYHLFSRVSTTLGDGILLSASLRFDGSTYNSSMQNLLNQPTVSLSASIPIVRDLFFNVNVGQFHQLPSYSILGYRDSSNQLANLNRVNFIRNQMISAGLQYNQGKETKITLEGFYKSYSQYPFSLNDSVNLANLGADFAVVGNEPISSFGGGRAYGAEFLIQRRSRNGFYGIASYTLAWSQFLDKNNQYIASSWDSRHTLSLTAGAPLGKNWELGAKWRYVSGRPYTPDDIEQSLRIANWNARGVAFPNYNALNAGRLGNFNQFDIRIDKVWYKKKYSLNLYLDIQNFFNTKYLGPQTLIAAQDANGNLLKDPNRPTEQYQADFLPNESGTVLPTIGIILDF